MNDAIVRHLKELIDRHGPGLGDDPRRLRSFLKDLSPGTKREIAILVAAAECGIPKEIRESSATYIWPIVEARLVSKLVDEHAKDESASRWCVRGIKYSVV